jgi:hypothetical protein
MKVDLINTRWPDKALCFVNGVKGKRLHYYTPCPEDGPCRLVFGFDKYVLKCDYDVKGKLTTQCAAEVDRWERISRHDRRYFPKQLAHGTYKDERGKPHTWVLYRRLHMKAGRPPLAARLRVKSLANKYALRDLCWSCEAVNWAVDRETGRPCIYDFAV